MGATKLNIALAAVLVGSGILLVFEHQATTKVREKNQAMQQQVEQVGRLGEENQRLSNLVAQASNPASLPKDQLGELLRLRGEVGPLRRQKAEGEKLRAENSRLRAAPTSRSPTALTPSASAPDYLPRKSWAFVGYGDPESALQSSFWAWSSGDPNAVVASMSPGHRASWGYRTDEQIAAQAGPEHGEGQRISHSEQAGLDEWGGAFHCVRGSDESKGQVQAETSRVGVEI